MGWNKELISTFELAKLRQTSIPAYEGIRYVPGSVRVTRFVTLEYRQTFRPGPTAVTKRHAHLQRRNCRTVPSELRKRKLNTIVLRATRDIHLDGAKNQGLFLTLPKRGPVSRSLNPDYPPSAPPTEKNGRKQIDDSYKYPATRVLRSRFSLFIRAPYFGYITGRPRVK